MIFYFSISIIITFILYTIIGQYYALDHPNSRKQHKSTIPQIGGLIFGPCLLILGWWLGIAPLWYIVGGLVSILLGTADDIIHVRWQIKLLVQLALAIYISNIFWGNFDTIIFYNYSLPVTQSFLFVIFLLWFVGIYNAVNLLDGLDGLAGGFMFIVCISTAFSDINAFSQLNIILAILLLGFLVFNQRPAKLFMGDAGSLFLGFHIVVLPLLFVENNNLLSNTLQTTPFLLLASFLIADTTRVFFTRLADKSNPMTADTIHFHHVILQQSGSYLVATVSIYIVTFITALIAAFSFSYPLSANFLLGHLTFLLFFILAPPVQTYVPLVMRLIKPFYGWQINYENRTTFLPRTLFITVLLLSLLSLIFFNSDLSMVFQWKNILGILLLLIIIIFQMKDKLVIYVVQLSIVIFIAELAWNSELGTFSKLFSSLLLLSYLIFAVERRIGFIVTEFSALDILIILFTLGGIALSNLGFAFSGWFFLILLSLWFGLGSTIRRIFYYLDL